MDSPIPLDSMAQSHWQALAPALETDGILTDRDRFAFAIMCQIWSKLQSLDTSDPTNYRAAIQHDRLTKSYHSYAKQFGLMPRERKQSKMQPKPAPKEDSEFKL
jgi:phage terminase small subunit